MQKNVWILLLIAAVAGVYIIGSGSFFLTAQPDRYYSYSAVAPTIQPNQPFSIPIKMTSNGQIEACTAYRPGNWGQYGNDYETYCRNAGYSGYCTFETLFNARSIRVSVDGEEIASNEFYATTAAPGQIAFTSQLGNVGAVSCWDVQGACSVTSDQNNAGTQSHRAWIYASTPLPAKTTTLNNATLLTLNFPAANFEPGNHTLDIYLFAETLGETSRCDMFNMPSLHPLSQVSGSSYGDQNNKQNQHFSIPFTVSGTANYSNVTIIVTNQSQNISLPPTPLPNPNPNPLPNPTPTPVPASNNNLVVLVVLGIIGLYIAFPYIRGALKR